MNGFGWFCLSMFGGFVVAELMSFAFDRWFPYERHLFGEEPKQ